MVVALLVIPLALIGAAAVAALISVRLSTLRITSAGVEIRNYPGPTTLVPLADVVRFEEAQPVGNFASLRPQTAVLVLTSGARLAVRALSAPDAGCGVDALNTRVASLRDNS